MAQSQTVRRLHTLEEGRRAALTRISPYLLVQPSPNEKEVQVIKISQAYVINSPDVEIRLGVSH